MAYHSQPHSQMNMFKKADDRKSNLILNVLSWVDFLKPRYCIFENVRGFLQYSLRARQDGPNRLKGGVSMGGLKLVVRALIDMEYVFADSSPRLNLKTFFVKLSGTLRSTPGRTLWDPSNPHSILPHCRKTRF